MSIALALEEKYPDYKYRGSLTDETKESFDNLVDLAGNKPRWSDVLSEANRISKEKADREAEDKEWEEYKKQKDKDEKEAWKLAGKPKYK